MPSIRRVVLAYITFFVAIGSSFPYLPVYYRSLGLGLAEIGLISATYSGVQLVGAPSWGALADRFHRSRKTLPLAALVAAAGGLLLAGGGDLPHVLAGALVLAIGLSGIGPVLDARSLETLGPDRIRFGQVRAFGSLSFVVTVLVVGAIVEGAGMRALFAVLVPGLVATALVASTLRRSPTNRSVSVLRNALPLVSGRAMRLFLLAVLLVFTAQSAVNIFYSVQLVTLGGRSAAIGTVWALSSIGEVPTMLAYPRLARRFGSTRLMVAGAVICALRAALASQARTPGDLILIAPAQGLGYALFFVGGVDHVSSRAPRGLAATAQGLYTATGGMAAIIGSAVGGSIAAAFSLSALFAVAAGVGCVGVCVLVLAVTRQRPVSVVADASAPAAESSG